MNQDEIYLKELALCATENKQGYTQYYNSCLTMVAFVDDDGVVQPYPENYNLSEILIELFWPWHRRWWRKIKNIKVFK